MLRIALDAGHGIDTAGKRCLKALDPNETREWWLNNRICNKIEDLLKSYTGYELLRVDDKDGNGKTDIALSERTRAANAFGADFYLSIHHNAGISGGNGGGIVAFSYSDTVGEGRVWRDALYDMLIQYTGLKGNRANPKTSANFQVLRDTDMPAVLLELGFMDSKTDVPIILSEEYADNCAKAIVEVLSVRGGLEKKDVEGEDLYRVQVGAFAKKENAEKLKAELIEKGYDAFILSR